MSIQNTFGAALPLLALVAGFQVGVVAYRRRVGCETLTFQVVDGSRPDVVDCSGEAALRRSCERVAFVLAIAGFGLVLLAVAFEPGVVPNVLIYAGAPLIAAYTFAPSVLYRWRSGRRAPGHFSSEIVDYLRKPTDQIAKRPRDVIGYSVVSALRLPVLLVLLLAIATLPSASDSTTWMWRLLPFVALGASIVALATMGWVRSGIVGRSKAIPSGEFLDMGVEDTAALLRSFADDRRRIPTTTSPRLSEFQFFDVRTRAERFERVLSWSIWPYAPPYALSEPSVAGREDPGVGRVLVPLDQPWEPVAAAMIARCRVVIVLIGSSPSLSWELGRLASTGRASDALFVVPPGSNDKGELLRTTLGHLEVTMPDSGPGDAVIGFRMSASGPVFYLCDFADEHAYAAMVEQHWGR